MFVSCNKVFGLTDRQLKKLDAFHFSKKRVEPKSLCIKYCLISTKVWSECQWGPCADVVIEQEQVFLFGREPIYVK